MTEVRNKMEQKNNYSYKDLLTCAKGELFGPGNAQLPMPPMLMFEKITNISSNGGANDKGVIQAEMSIKPDSRSTIIYASQTAMCRLTVLKTFRDFYTYL